MSSIQLQIRTDIEYLASSWKSPKVYPVNGDISKDKAFNKLPVLLSYIKPEESRQASNGNGKIQKWRIELFLAYTKLPDGCDPTTKSHDYDEQSSEMCELIDKLHTGLTKQYIAGVKNPIAHGRGYTPDQPLSFLDTYFEFGSNKYMAVRATWSMIVNVANCFDCTDFIAGTFDSVNTPPNDTNPVGGLNGQKGDILYWNDILEKWVRLNIGADGQVLKAVDGLPEWGDETGGGITEETDPIFTAWEATNGANLISHLSATNNPHQVTKAQVGLSNVDNTSDVDKPISTATQTALDAKQDALGYSPEAVANKTDTMAGNTASSTKYLSAKGVYDWVISLGYITTSALSGYATQVWVNSQGFITNVVTALGYTPANKAGETFTGAISATNLSGNNTGDNATNSQYSGLAASKEDAANKSTSTADIASSVKFPVWSAVVSYVTGLGYQAALTAANFGSFINSLTAKTTPVDADGLALMDSAASNTAKFLSWANLKATLKTYFDGIYNRTHVIAKFSGAATVNVSSAGETLMQSLFIPANTFTNGDLMPALVRGAKDNNGSSARAFVVYIHTSASAGGSVIARSASSSSGNFYGLGLSRIFPITSSGLLALYPSLNFVDDVNYNTTSQQVNNTYSAINVDWTQGQYINIFGTSNSVTLASFTLHAVTIQRL